MVMDEDLKPFAFPKIVFNTLLMLWSNTNEVEAL